MVLKTFENSQRRHIAQLESGISVIFIRACVCVCNILVVLLNISEGIQELPQLRCIDFPRHEKER